MGRTRSILIIGGSGFIGTHLALRLREGYKVFATYDRHPMRMPGVTYLPMNVSSRSWVKRVVYMAHPDIVIYAAGSPSVEDAENDARETEKTHTGGPATVSNVADILQPKFIFLSSCYSFDGHKGGYRESDIVLPTTQLGKAKVGGENFIRGRSLNYLIVRSSPVFGRSNGQNPSVLDKMRTKLDRGQRVDMPSHELHSFAPVSALADFICRLVESGPRNKVFHFGGLTKLTQYEFARSFAERFGYDPNLVVERRAQEQISGLMAAPLDYSLNSSLAAQTLKVEPLLLEQGFDLIEKELVPRA